MFGTYQAEEEPVQYGLTEPLGSVNPLVNNVHELITIVRDCVTSKRLSDLAHFVFGRPGWLPPER